MASARSLLCISLALVAIICLPKITRAQTWEEVVPKVKQKCASQYPDDFAMQAYCIKEQHEGWIAINGSDAPSSNSVSSQLVPQRSVEPPATMSDVSVEAQFVAAVTQFRTAYGNAANEMQRGALRPSRGRALCTIMPRVEIRNWQGTVYSLSTNSEGNGVIKIDLGNEVYVETMNNTLSDSGYNTLIPYGTALFDKVSSLSKGSQIEFSGNLFRDPIDCFKETSLMTNGTMTAPEFVIRITAVGHQDVAPQSDAIANPVPQAETSAFADGQNARIAYEKWYSGLSEGDYRNGAEFWAAHRSDRLPPSCSTGSSEFQAGCTEATRRLTPSDIRRRADVDFKRGWNSL